MEKASIGRGEYPWPADFQAFGIKAVANILFLSHRIPYPPNKGDKIRSWNFLSRLAKHHNVHAGFIVDDVNDWQHIPFLKKTLTSVCAVKVRPFVQKLLSLRGFLYGTSLTQSAYPTNTLKKFSKRIINNNNIDLVILFSAASAAFLPKECAVPLIVDLVDVDSEKWGAYSKTASWPVSWVYAREASKLALFETQLAKRSDLTILVSDDEAEILRRLNPGLAPKIKAIANGVDTVIFDANKYPGPSVDNCIIFTGAMDYPPNIEAVEWFCERVWPAVVAGHPEVTFKIAGGPEVPRVRQLESHKGVSVTGYVEDMASVLAGASVAVVPLHTARGIQNKLLEALSMGRAVVATSKANEGVNAGAGRHLLIANSPEEFVQAINTLLTDEAIRAALGTAGRKFAKDQFSWSRSFDLLNAEVIDRC